MNRWFLSKLRNLIKRARITKGGADSGQFNVQQASYLGKVSDLEVVFPYGMSANLPEDSLVLMFNVGGNDQNRAGIGSFPQQRKKNLAPGEVAFFHPFTKSFIYFRNNGDLDIETPTDTGATGGAFSAAFASAFDQAQAGFGSVGNVNITTQNATINTTQNMTVNAAETVEINAGTRVNVNTPITNLGEGGLPIARQGDPVQVQVTSGSSAGVWQGTIVTGGTNTSI